MDELSDIPGKTPALKKLRRLLQFLLLFLAPEVLLVLESLTLDFCLFGPFVIDTLLLERLSGQVDPWGRPSLKEKWRVAKSRKVASPPMNTTGLRRKTGQMHPSGYVYPERGRESE